MATLILRQLAEAPRLLFWGCLAGMVILAWTILWNMEQTGFLAAICQPFAPTTPPFSAIFAMWLAMSLAMMLPTAAPMLATYLDIAGAARQKGIGIVSPYMLALGYVSVWMGFSMVAAAIQITLPPITNTSYAGAMFITAGVYQFSPLKHACLSKCRQPMAYFLAEWTDRTSGVYQIGVTQGLLCLGCCWALMALALITGLMNIIWMAGLGILMLLEKVLPANAPVIYGLGVGLIAAGVAMAMVG